LVLTRIVLLATALLALQAVPASANHDITQLVSTGPSGGNAAFDAPFQFSSADGSHVLFRTAERLVSSDTDSSIDVYERVGATTTLVSAGPTGGNGAFDATAVGISEDGSHAFFYTQEQLVAADTDNEFDVYARAAGTTTLVTAGTTSAASFAGSSADGSHVFFHSADELVVGDTDSQTDVYERFGGTTTLVSTGPTGGNGNFVASARAVSADGSRVVFETSEQLTGGDTDSTLDLYARSGGTTELLSVGPGSGNLSGVTFGGASRDGATVAFQVEATCVGTFFPGCTDLYARSAGTTTRVSLSNGAFAGFSKDGQHLYYMTISGDAPGDGDFCGSDFENDYGCPDIYDFSGGTRRLVSVGGRDDCFVFTDVCQYMTFGGASADGSVVFFSTQESLTADDDTADRCFDLDGRTSCYDVYENSVAGGTRLLSKHSSPGASDGLASGYVGNSDDGTRVFYLTSRRSAPDDTDSSVDIFERFANATTLISTGPAGGNGAFTPTYRGASADGKRVFFETNEQLLLSDLDSNADVYQSSVGTGYPRPKGATPMRVPLVPAFNQCTSSNSTHGAPLSYGSCSPPAPEATTAFIGIGDGNPAPAKSIGSVRLAALVGAAGPPDDTDVKMDVSITNVMNTSDRSDYTGELRLELPLRITDRLNGSPVDTGTVIDTSFFATVPCTATGDPTLGSACTLSSTADAILPATVREGGRAIWALGKVRVHDGGPDGDADTPGDNELFAVQGLFVP
jgi:hypothetical protein